MFLPVNFELQWSATGFHKETILLKSFPTETTPQKNPCEGRGLFFTLRNLLFSSLPIPFSFVRWLLLSLRSHIVSWYRR